MRDERFDIYGDGFVIHGPPSKKWTFCLNNDWSVQFHVAKGPNWFHRIMQRLILGIHWRKYL